MNKILIGSTALKHWYKDFNREPKDLDYICKNIENKNKGDCIVIPFVFEYVTNNIAPSWFLLTLKLSHIFWNKKGNLNWRKHMWDIQFLLNNKVEYNKEVFLKLKEFWKVHYGGLQKSNLNLNKEDFFDNAINNTIDHDTLHTYLKKEPTYLKVLKEGKEVEPCPIKWNNLSSKDKDSLFQEEIMVMAWERFPNMYFKKAYYLMCNKYIRNHLPDFCFDYIIKNYIRLSLAPYDFIKIINSKYVRKNI